MVHPRQLLACLALLASASLWARLEIPPEAVDLNAYLPKASFLLRAEILAISDPPNPPEQYVATAHLRVTRWYRGQPRPAVVLRFSAGGLRTPGHNCIAFQPGTHWLILANERDGALELIDDCYGAFELAPQIGAMVPGLLPQLEADFSAGLSAANPGHRILSLQRLANLRMPTSRPALQEVIARSHPDEAIWAAYAALRTGDISVIPAVNAMLQKASAPWPSSLLSRELRAIHDHAALPTIAANLNMARSTNTPLAADAPPGTPFQGTYENHFGYAYRVTVPPGLTGWKSTPPAPQHGFNIDLPAGARISVDASYDTLDYSNARQAAKAHAEYLRTEQLSPPRFQKTKLGGLTAVKTTIRYRAAASNASRERFSVIALRSTPPVGIVYEIVLDRPISRSRQYRRVYTALVNSFQLTPLPK